MNKDEIKKMLDMCIDPNADCRGICKYCDYIYCQDYLCRDALNLINEQEAEIDRLKEENKQVQIEVLNKVKECIYDISPYNPFVTKVKVEHFIDGIIKEVENRNV